MSIDVENLERKKKLNYHDWLKPAGTVHDFVHITYNNIYFMREILWLYNLHVSFLWKWNAHLFRKRADGNAFYAIL